MISAGFRRTICKITAGMLAFILCILSGCANDRGGDLNGGSGGTEPAVTLTEAKKAALKDAHVKEKDAIITRRKLVRDTSDPVYRICFTTESSEENTRYAYSIDGMTGKVLDREKKVQTASPANISGDPGGDSDEHRADTEDFIGVRKAKEAAQIDSGLDRDEVTFTSVRLVSRNGRMIYEVDFKTVDVEYQFDVDAFSGKVIEREVVFDE